MIFFGKQLRALFLFFILLFPIFVSTVSAWSNGGYSTDPSNPKYGTHDWIVEHAKNWLPMSERKWIDSNLNYFLYGTEYPDNSAASYSTTNGYGDTTKHHNYYDIGGSVTDDSAAIRAKEECDNALAELKAGRNDTAAIYAGSMTHYIDDLGVFGHVMTNETHHSDYESYVRSKTTSFNYGVFESYLVYDGKLENISAYNASISLGRNTWNDYGGTYTANWMDTNYNWSNPVFKNRCGESLNLVTNYIADVLHTLSVAAFGTTAVTQKIEHMIVVDSSTFKVVTVSNSTINGCQLNKTQKKLFFNVTGASGTVGFCNITFPTNLLGGPYVITIYGSQVTSTANSNATHSSLYFTYDQTTQKVDIHGLTVIPELPTMVANVIVLAVLALMLTFIKRTHRNSIKRTIGTLKR